MSAELKYLSDMSIAQLNKDILLNVERYNGAGFEDLAEEPGWDIPLGIEYDAELLAKLDLSRPQSIAPIDLKNSIIVGEALQALTPSVANEERIWVRLAHIEAFEYCRVRWIGGLSGDALLAAVKAHFFASTQTGIRDDHALSRLWWSYEIARICQPDDVSGALALIMKSADIRSNFVERIWMTSRQKIASAVLKAMRDDPWITGTQNNFRDFMKAINLYGGGVVFEALSEEDASQFVTSCVKAIKGA